MQNTLEAEAAALWGVQFSNIAEPINAGYADPVGQVSGSYVMPVATATC